MYGSVLAWKQAIAYSFAVMLELNVFQNSLLMVNANDVAVEVQRVTRPTNAASRVAESILFSMSLLRPLE